MIAAFNNSQGRAALVISPSGDITQDVILKAVPSGTPYILIDETDPKIAAFVSDATYRDAWVVSGDNLKIDLAAKRRIYGAGA